jgi:hypothetical protein
MFSSINNINRNYINSNVITITTISKSKKIFEYKSNIEIDGWWHTEIKTARELKFYVYLSEIAGYKFEQFSSFSQFLDFIQKITFVRYLKLSGRIINFLNKKNFIVKKNQFRQIKTELNKTRRIRAIKINRLIKNDIDKLKLIVQACKNKLPTDLYKVILKEFVGLEFKGGCFHCKKANRPFDTIISHNSLDCKYIHKHLHCVNCSTSSRICISHTTDKCYNYCSSCRSTRDCCLCDDYYDDEHCEDCGRPNAHCYCGMRSDSDDESRGEYCVYCRSSYCDC